MLIAADGGRIDYANAAAENLLDSSLKALSHKTLSNLFVNGDELAALCQQARAHKYADVRQDLTLERSGREALHVHERKWDATIAALKGAWEPILASGGTVIAGLLIMSAAMFLGRLPLRTGSSATNQSRYGR